MDQASPRGLDQNATIAVVLAVLVFIGTFAAYYYKFLKPKIEEIASLEVSKRSKEDELRSKLNVIKEQKNYEVRLAVLHDQWHENKHWFVNGTTDWTDREQVASTQFTIFDLYWRVLDLARASGIDVDDRSFEVPFQLIVDEELKFYLDDEPYDLPYEFFFLLENLQFMPSNRFPDAAGDGLASVTTEGKELFNAHNFEVKFTGSYESLSRFTKNLQQRFGQEDTLIAVHCYSTDGDPILRPSGGFFGGPTVSNVMIAYDVFCSAYAIFDAPNITINTPPNLPGETDCKSGGGGGRGGGGGGGGGSAGSGGGLSLGVG